MFTLFVSVILNIEFAFIFVTLSFLCEFSAILFSCIKLLISLVAFNTSLNAFLDISNDMLTDNWILGGYLNKGGFSKLFKVTKRSNGEKGYVVKLEFNKSKKENRERKTYQLIRTYDTINKTKCNVIPTIYEMGECQLTGQRYNLLGDSNTNLYSYIIMKEYATSSVSLNKMDSNRLKLKCALQAFDAISYLHRVNIIHLDIKPRNFMLDYDNQLKLIDFGLSRICELTEDQLTCRRKNKPKDSWSGTLKYIGLDVHYGNYSKRSDLQSMAYTMLIWFGAKLPWDKYCFNSKFHRRVARSKERLLKSNYTSILTELNINFIPTECSVIDAIRSIDDINILDPCPYVNCVSIKDNLTRALKMELTRKN